MNKKMHRVTALVAVILSLILVACKGESPTSPPPTPAPMTVTGNAFPSTVPYGGDVKVEWTASVAAAKCTSGAWDGEKPYTGSVTISNVTANRDLEIVCTCEGRLPAKTIVPIRVQATPTVCNYNASPESEQFPAEGNGNYSISVETGSDCEWYFSYPPWIHASGPVSGKGPGSFAHYPEANNTGSARNDVIYLKDKSGKVVDTIAVSQAAKSQGCTYVAIPAEEANTSCEAGEGSFAIVTQPGCPVKPESDSPDWLKVVPDPNCGASCTNVRYTKTKNTTGALRTGKIKTATCDYIVRQPSCNVEPPCTPASVTNGPSSTTINAGQSATLSVSASGTAPISYQWYIGSSGNTSSPISGANGSSLTVSPSSTTSYWVKVTNACGSGNSATATVTVNQPPTSCTRSGSANTTLTGRATCPDGSVKTVSWPVSASGSGTASDCATAQSLANEDAQRNLQAKLPTEQSKADAEAARLCPQCTPASVTSGPSSTTINAGQSATLSVSASGTAPISYQWYIGSSGNTSSPISGANGSSLTVSPSSTTSYWVKVTNACGSGNSATATVTVNTAQRCKIKVVEFIDIPAGGYSSRVFSVGIEETGIAESECRWSVTDYPWWFEPTTSTSGAGNGSVNYKVPAHQGTDRTSTFWVRDLTFGKDDVKVTITQKGTP